MPKPSIPAPALDITNPRAYLDAWLERVQMFDFVAGKSFLCQAWNCDVGLAACDPYWARYAAMCALDDAARALGFKSSWSNGVDRHHAERAIVDAHFIVRPGAPPLSPAQKITFKEAKGLYSFLDRVVSTPARQSRYHPPSDEHVWLEARAHGLFQRYGRIYPDNVTLSGRSGDCNFDFFMVTRAGPIVVEVMSGYWPGKYASKFKLADDFAKLGVLSVFVGYAPETVRKPSLPWTLWSVHGPMTVGGKPGNAGAGADENRVLQRFNPSIRPRGFYLPEPEICDEAGKPFMEIISHLGTSDVRDGASVYGTEGQS